MTTREQSFQRAHDAVVHNPAYQFSLPTFQRPKDPEWLLALLKFLGDNWFVIKWILWITAGVVVLTIVGLLVRRYGPLLLRFRRGGPDGPAEPEWRPTQAQARRLLEESDAFAARGLYAEAVHLILLRSIEDIREKRPRLVRPTLTSREIARLDALPETARRVFSGIAGVVERALFAGREVGPADFARCREDYKTFALLGDSS